MRRDLSMVRRLEKIEKEIGYCEIKLEKEQRLLTQLHFLRMHYKALQESKNVYRELTGDAGEGTFWKHHHRGRHIYSCYQFLSYLHTLLTIETLHEHGIQTAQEGARQPSLFQFGLGQETQPLGQCRCKYVGVKIAGVVCHQYVRCASGGQMFQAAH